MNKHEYSFTHSCSSSKKFIQRQHFILLQNSNIFFLYSSFVFIMHPTVQGNTCACPFALHDLDETTCTQASGYEHTQCIAQLINNISQMNGENFVTFSEGSENVITHQNKRWWLRPINVQTAPPPPTFAVHPSRCGSLGTPSEPELRTLARFHEKNLGCKH